MYHHTERLYCMTQQGNLLYIVQLAQEMSKYYSLLGAFVGVVLYIGNCDHIMSREY